MTITELYDQVGDYSDVISRLMKEERIVKYLGRFVEDSSDFDKMVDAFNSSDYQQLFATSHTLKGVAANLGLTKLFKASSDVCESVRNGPPTQDIAPLMEKAIAEYNDTVSKIKAAL